MPVVVAAVSGVVSMMVMIQMIGPEKISGPEFVSYKF